MKSPSKISGTERRADIIRTAGALFAEKGFSATTTRELAAAAGVSEALLYKHFPSKEALYSAIVESCFEDEASKIIERLRSVEPCTSALVVLVQSLISDVLGRKPDEGKLLFSRLLIRSLMDEGEFSRLVIQEVPKHWVDKVTQCVEAAKASGDMLEETDHPSLGGWFVEQLVTGVMIHSLPSEPVIDYGVNREDLVEQLTGFCLRGIGLKEEAIQRCEKDMETSNV